MSYFDPSQKVLNKQELNHKFVVLISTSNKRRLVCVRIIMFLQLILVTNFVLVEGFMLKLSTKISLLKANLSYFSKFFVVPACWFFELLT
jgi:hypothetical protein